MGCVYLATNVINGYSYVGMTMKSLSNRKKEHLAMARKNNPKQHIHRAIKKYGERRFIWKIIYESAIKDELLVKEQEYIAFYDSVKYGYNMTLGGEGVWLTPEGKQKRSLQTKELYNNLEYVQNRQQGIDRYYADPNNQKLLQQRVDKRYSDPIWLEKWKAACKAGVTEETRKKHAEFMRKRMAKIKEENPDYFKNRNKRTQQKV